ncbi:Armadillo [Dillenia turbinata]|uniref:Armadillo n=1 Tax=Dillenia turbinata TaxID=194707 RepID=A0AAN8VWN4_9MAGN
MGSNYVKNPLLAKVLNWVATMLTNDSADVRVAACICIKCVSRSIKSLSAGLFMNEMIVIPLIELLHDSSVSVQVAALGAISNIVVDFTMQKLAFISCGGLQQLVHLSKSMDSSLRLNAVWALRNLAFLADIRCKEETLLELTSSTLVSLINDPEPFVQEQALAFTRNLVDGNINSIELVHNEDCALLNAAGQQLWSASRTEVQIQISDIDMT